MKKVFFRYVASLFWGPFAFGLGVFLALIMFGTAFDKLAVFSRNDAGAGLFLSYIALHSPYFAARVIPMATLMAALFALGDLMSRGEWKAGLAGGYRPAQMLAPLLACSLGAAALHLAVQELLVPPAYMKAQELYYEDLRGSRDWRRLVQRDVSFSVGGGVFLSARVFDGGAGRMEKVSADFYRDRELIGEIAAESAVWDPGRLRWVFNGASVTEYLPSGPAVSSRAEHLSEISLPPGSMVIDKLVPEGISMRGLLLRVKRLRFIGAPAAEEMTVFWGKLAAPLANPVMALLGAAVVLLLGSHGKLFNLGIAIGSGFLLWAAMMFGQSAGQVEMVGPLTAAFGPLLVFLALGIWGLRRARAI
ncbi:MAG: permease YjgP/YjgQ family protein [Elusimicrobia bacterium]|nr:MAG: permease YjgP/YjgQ family protein [Elusimicrobiota bacterium]KAF0157360.1 MAG: permease YjgP/YjgQ family protein [Elusimicrobiota bacterium]